MRMFEGLMSCLTVSYSVNDAVSMQFLQTIQDHVRYGLHVLFDQRINRVFEVVVQITLAVLHHDAELVVFDLVVVDSHHLVRAAYILVLNQFEVLDFSDEVLFVLVAGYHFLHGVDLT